MTTNIPDLTGDPLAHEPNKLSRLMAKGAGLSLIALAVLLVVKQASWRIVEARSSSWVAGKVTGFTMRDTPGQPEIYFDAGNRGWIGVHLGLACSTVLLITPLLILSGLLLMSTTKSRMRIVVATAIAAAVIYAANMVRMTMIIAFAHKWGDSGFQWGHVLLGSILMIATAGMALLIYVKVATGRKKDKVRRRAAHRGSAAE